MRLKASEQKRARSEGRCPRSRTQPRSVTAGGWYQTPVCVPSRHDGRAARSKLRVFRFEVCGVAELVHRGLRGCFPGNAGRKRDTGLAPGAPIR